MRTKVWIETEVEVDVNVTDIINALCDLPDPERMSAAISGISACLVYVANVPDKMLEEMNDAQREIIASTMEEQAARYKTPDIQAMVSDDCGGSCNGGARCSEAM